MNGSPVQSGPPLITVAIPTYSRPKLVGEAIQSCLQQDFQDFELLISDDCPTEEIKHVVASFHSPKIRYTRHLSHVSLGKKLNDFLKEGNGEWLVILGDDDTFEPGYLSAMARTIREHPDAALVWPRYRFIDTEGRFIKDEAERPACLEPPDFLNVIFLPWYKNMVNITGVLFPRRKLLELGGFLETDKGWNTDTAAWAWLGLQGRCYFESRPLVRLRFNTDSAYKKFTLDYPVYLKDKRLFFNSVNALFESAFRSQGGLDRQKVERARRLFIKHWMREEARFRLDGMFIHFLGLDDREARREVGTLVAALKNCGLPVRSRLFWFYGALSFMPSSVRKFLLAVFRHSRNFWRRIFPPESWTFFVSRGEGYLA